MTQKDDPQDSLLREAQPLDTPTSELLKHDAPEQDFSVEVTDIDGDETETLAVVQELATQAQEPVPPEQSPDSAPTSEPIIQQDADNTDDADDTDAVDEPKPQTEDAKRNFDSAGWRAGRRIRRGWSFKTSYRLSLLSLLLCALAVWLLHLRFPVSAALPTNPEARVSMTYAVEQLKQRSQVQETESRKSHQKTLDALLNALLQAPVVVLGQGVSDSARAEADTPARLKGRINEVVKDADSSLRAALVNAKGQVVFAAGDLDANSPALKSYCQALTLGQSLPAPLLGQISAAHSDGLRLALISTGPSLADLPLDAAQAAAQLLEQDSRQLLQERDRLIQDLAEAQQHRAWLLWAMTAGLVVIWLTLSLGLWSKLHEALSQLLALASARAGGAAVPEQQSLPLEFATLDDILANQLATAQEQRLHNPQHEIDDAKLEALIQSCRNAVEGDLAQRAPLSSGKLEHLAEAINQLLDNFAERALRLRSHARNADSQTPDAPPTQAFAALQARARAFHPLSGLLQDIATRLRVSVEGMNEGRDLTTELLHLAEAVAARAKTVHAYQLALTTAVDTAQSQTSGQAMDDIAQELANLRLNDNFAEQVQALRKLPIKEIRRRLDNEKNLANASAAIPENAQNDDDSEDSL